MKYHREEEVFLFSDGYPVGLQPRNRIGTGGRLALWFIRTKR